MKEQDLGRGQKIIGFESLEEMIAYEQDREHDAIAGALPPQWEIDWGGYVIRFVDDSLVIFGQLHTRKQLVEESIADGATEDEALVELSGMQQSFHRGYRYGQWFSEVVPEGEYGSAHVVSLWSITQTDFERARAVGWQIWRELASRVATEITEAVKEHASGNDHPEQHGGEDAPDVSGD